VTANNPLPPGNYRLKYTYLGASGETKASPESDVFTLAAGNGIRMTLHEPVPAGATGINVYLTPATAAAGPVS